MGAENLKIPWRQGESHERLISSTVHSNEGGSESNLSFRSRTVRTLAKTEARRDDVRTLLVRLVVRLYLDRQGKNKLAA